MSLHLCFLQFSYQHLWLGPCFSTFSLCYHGDVWFGANHRAALPVYPFHHVLWIAPMQFMWSRCKKPDSQEFAFPKLYKPSLQKCLKCSDRVCFTTPIWYFIDIWFWTSDSNQPCHVSISIKITESKPVILIYRIYEYIALIKVNTEWLET